MRIKSYRAVFALERRIYRVDGLALNPAGVPLRSIAYFLGLLLAVLLAGRLPLIGAVVGIVPWYVRGLVAPLLLAGCLTAIRLDGRPCHTAARSLLGYLLAPRLLVGFQRRRRLGSRLHLGALAFLADGSDARPRRLRYSGPGAFVCAGELTPIGDGVRVEVRT